MQKIIKFLIPIFIFLILVMPVFSFAAGLVPECDRSVPGQCTWGFSEFMKLIDNVIKFILFKMAIPIAAIMFVYAGFELVTSGGSTEKRGTAKKVFTNAVYGLVLAAGAWLIVKTLLSILGYKDIGFFLFLK